MVTVIERVWFEDPRSFITVNNYDQFLPSREMSNVQQLNSLLRLSVYFAAVCLVLVQNVTILVAPLVVALFTYHMHATDRTNAESAGMVLEKMQAERDNTGATCRVPTKANPYMNVLMSDFSQDPTRPKACNLVDKHVAQSADRLASSTLYTDVDDVFNRDASNRPFYTTSSTTIPNDQNAFASWCYRPSGKTCKEGNYDACLNKLYDRP